MSRWIVGQASDYLFHLPELLVEAYLQVVLYVRVSADAQAETGNLREATADAERQLAERDITPIKTFSIVEGSRLRDDRQVLEAALAYARRHGAILVAPSRDRFLRGELAGPGCPRHNELPSVAEYRWLLRLADGVPLATLLHPDAPARGQQTRRGMRAKDRRGGRPVPGYKKRRRLLNQTKIRWLIGLGLSARAVARLLNLHPNQVARWLPK